MDQKSPFWVFLDWNLVMSYLKSSPSSFSQHQKLSYVDNSNKKWNQKCLICVFWPINLKNYCYIWKQYLRICQNSNNCSKQKKQRKNKQNKRKNLEQKCLIWHFGLQVWKAIDIFEISSLEFVKMQSFVQK